MARWNSEERKWHQDPDNTQINISKKTKEELKELLIEESFRRGDRITMKKMVSELIEFYKDKNLDNNE